MIVYSTFIKNYITLIIKTIWSNKLISYEYDRELCQH